MVLNQCMVCKAFLSPRTELCCATCKRFIHVVCALPPPNSFENFVCAACVESSGTLSVSDQSSLSPCTSASCEKSTASNMAHRGASLDLKEPSLTDLYTMLESLKSDISVLKKDCKSLPEIRIVVSSVSSKLEELATGVRACQNLVSDVNARCSALEQRCSANTVAVQSLTTTVEAFSPGVAQTSPLIVRDVIAELAKQDRWRCSVVLSGLPESHQSSSSPLVSDSATVIDIISAIIPDQQFDGLKIFRLGAPSAQRTRPRLIKVICTSVDQASYILRSANSVLKSNERFKDIRIFSDKTALQTRYLRSLKDELHNRSSKGETNLYIRHVHGVPRILSKPSLPNTANRVGDRPLN